MAGEVIRAATPGDAAEIGAMHVRAWQGAYRGLLPQDFLDGLDPAARGRHWQQSLAGLDWKRGGVQVLRAGASIVGVTSYGPSPDAADDPAFTGEVSAIYLLPDYWGQGLGQRLMAAALTELADAGYREGTLWVLDANVRARRFYERGGWAPDGGVQRDERPGFTMTEVRYRRPLLPTRTC